MKRKLLSALLLAALGIVSVSAQKVAQPCGNWLQQALAVKEKMNSLQRPGFPYMSEEYRRGTAPGKVSVDVTGLKQITLSVWDTPDGSDYDWAVWANARFTKKDGTVVRLDQMRPSFRRIQGNWFSVNQNLSNRPLQIRDTHYDYGVLAHAPSTLVYDLNGEYVRFDSEIGVDEGSSGGSVIFKVMTTSGREEADALVKQCPEITQEIRALVGVPVSDWLTAPGTLLERAAVLRTAVNLKDHSYFDKQIEAIEKNPSMAARINDYVRLKQDAFDILNIQGQIDWINIEAIGAAIADMKTMKGFDGAAADKKYAELKSLMQKGFSGLYSNNKEAIASAQRALALKQEILLANPALDMDKIIATRYQLGAAARYVMAPSLGTQANNWSNQYSASRSGFDASIVELSNLRAGMSGIKERQIYKPENDDAVTDVHLHFDAGKMLFTSTDENKRWNIYEINVDGSNYHKVTNIPEPDIEWTDGAYLPDGRLIINTTLGYHGVPCVDGDDAVGNLALYDPKTGYLRRLTFDQDNNWNPTVMNNGRVMYTRWEYTDLIHYFSRFVMHMNPDGTENKNLYGSGSYFPNSTFDMQPLPNGSSAFVGIISGHHGIARSGRLIIFDPAKSRKEEKGMVQELPFSKRPIEPLIKDELVNGVWPQFIKPHPLTDKYFLVTAKLTENSLWGIYLVDVYDNLTLVMEAEGEGFINPIPLKKRPTPPIIPDRIDLKKHEATVFIQDIYEGEGLPGVPRGTVKKLRILAYEYAYIKSPSNHAAQGIQSGWDIKRLLGEVPVEEDGSVIFTIPANTPVSIQPLDDRGRAVQWMRSWFVGQPGETVSCVGCHEDLNQIPIPKRVIASTKKPSKIEAPEGGVRPFTFELEIQPILDRACIACHTENSKISFVAGPEKIAPGQRRYYNFSQSYLNFHPYFYRQGPEADMYVLTPYEFHASNSEMIQMLEDGHHGVQLTDKEWKTLYNWIDFNAPYNSSFSRIRELKVGDHGYDQVARRKELADKYADSSAVDWQKEIADYADYLALQPKQESVMPAQPNAKPAKEVKVKGWPFAPEAAAAMVAGTEKREVDLGNGIKMTFVRVPAGEFVMGSTKGTSSPEAKAKISEGFWMAEMEVSNAQMRALMPAHDNRLIGQFWKDHTGPHYMVNEDSLSSIRVSWNEAMEYCNMLSEKTGLKVTLPTEAQWEWAARAGSATPFWWGNLNTPFDQYDNLADWNLTKMAVTGVDPQPMSSQNPVYRYWNYIPKDESVNDGHMLLTSGKQYAPNPWGLYDMNGNVAEWTRSDFNPYPYNMKKDGVTVDGAEKVARGGSWYDRTKKATSASRRHFLPWQRVWNVGFRVIIED